MIEWVKFPRFELVNTPPHKVAVVIEEGEVCLDGRVVDFPVGWATDITSTPRIFYSILPQIGGHNSASLLHDRLLDLRWPRHIARRYMSEQLDLLHVAGDVSKYRRALMLTGIWIYDQYRKLKL
jgi:hypothetical protein